MPKSSPDSPPPPLVRYHPEGPVTTESRVGLCPWQDKTAVVEAGKVGEVVVRVAAGVKYGGPAVEYLASVPARLPGVTIAVEFRDASWLPRHAEETLALLRDRQLTYVSVDAPRTPASVDTAVALTSPTAILRLHGRNREGFMKQLRGQGPSVAEKYGYLYNREELTGIVARGRALEGQARRVYFKLHHNVGDAPALDGEAIKELLAQEIADRAAGQPGWRSRPRARAAGPPSPPASAGSNDASEAGAG